MSERSIPARSAAVEAGVRVAIDRAQKSGWSSRFETADVRAEISQDVSERTVRRALKDLAAMGWVEDRRHKWQPGERAEQYQPSE